MRAVLLLPLLLGLAGASLPANALSQVDEDKVCADDSCKRQFKKLFKYARYGNPEALFLVGTALLTGDGMDQDVDRGVHYLKKAVLGGSARAAWHLAQTYRDGRWLDRDPVEANHYLQRAAKQGFGPALFTLATSQLDFQASRDSQGNAKALALLENAIDNRYPQAMYLMAKMHQTNTLVEQDLFRAADLFNRLTQIGYRDSRERLDQVLAIGEQQPQLQARLDTLNTDIEVITVTGEQWSVETALESLKLRFSQDQEYNGVPATGTLIKTRQERCDYTHYMCRRVQVSNETRHRNGW